MSDFYVYETVCYRVNEVESGDEAIRRIVATGPVERDALYFDSLIDRQATLIDQVEDPRQERITE